jgi:hypothetical protein
MAERFRMGVAQVYPILGPAMTAEPYVLIHYNGNKCSVTMMC